MCIEIQHNFYSEVLASTCHYWKLRPVGKTQPRSHFFNTLNYKTLNYNNFQTAQEIEPAKYSKVILINFALQVRIDQCSHFSLRIELCNKQDRTTT